MINFDLVIGFEWDTGNSHKSELKHAVSMAEAEEVFMNEPILFFADESIVIPSRGFWRWV